MQKIIRVFLCFSMLLILFGCKQETELVQETTNDNQQETEETVIDEFDTVEIKQLETKYSGQNIWNNQYAIDAYCDFAIRQLAYCYDENDNEIISPLSLYYALAILANGASNDTRKELESVLGMTVEDLNEFLSDFDNEFDNTESKYYNKANAIWFNTLKGLSLKEDYKNTISKYYGDSFFEGDFSDGQKVVNEANQWSSKQTDGAIQDVMNDGDITDETTMLILNALTAGDKWGHKFESSETYYEEFNGRDNSKTLVEMMHETEWGYINDGRSEGFIKWLENNSVFIGIVPLLGVDVYDYLNTMDSSTLSNYEDHRITSEIVDEFTGKNEWTGEDETCYLYDAHYTRLSFPMFEFDKEYDLDKTLKKFGLKNVFSAGESDFSALADGPENLIKELYLQKAKQKCSILVNEEEVKAAAVTSIYLGLGGGDGGCYQLRDNVYHDVVFNRPFIFALMTPTYSHKGIPMFIGIVTKIGEPIQTAFQIQNITGKINIRSTPSTKGEKLGTFAKDKIIYAFETKEAEGYTWYRIGSDKWVADKNGEWIKVLN